MKYIVESIEEIWGKMTYLNRKINSIEDEILKSLDNHAKYIVKLEQRIEVLEAKVKACSNNGNL